MSVRVDGTRTGRRAFACRVAVETPERLAALALEMGFYRIGAGGERQGAAGQLMDAIADGRVFMSRSWPEGQAGVAVTIEAL